MQLFLKVLCWFVLSLYAADPASAPDAPAVTPPSKFSLHLPNTGQGNCVLLRKEDNSFVGIFDCGSISGKVTKWKEKLEPLISGMSAADGQWLIVISHPDHDHYNFLPDIIEHIFTQLESDKIKLTLVLGGSLEKYFYYQGSYPLIETIKDLIKLNKPHVRVISMSHAVDHAILMEVIAVSEGLKKQKI